MQFESQPILDHETCKMWLAEIIICNSILAKVVLN